MNILVNLILSSKERLLKEIKLLEKIKPPKIDVDKPKELQLKIAELQQADFIKRREKEGKLLEKGKVSLLFGF